MEIISLKHSSFRIKGKKTTIVTDPYSNKIGYTLPKVDADIVTVSHDHIDHNNFSIVNNSPFVVTGPGEYDISDVKIIGFPSFHDSEKGLKRGKNTIYQFTIDNIVLVHCGDLGDKLTTEQVEEIGNPDILFIPVGGTFTIDSHIASEIVALLEPKIVIPMHYFQKDLSPEIFAGILPVETFLKEMGKENIPSQPKLSITKDKLPEETQIIVLE